MVIPVCVPSLIGNEKKYVQDCMDTNWISSNGKYIELFENEFAKFCDAKYGVACSNGTTALHLALTSLGIGKGDEVIVPSFSMIAITNAVLYTGATPVFVDSEMKTWNIDTNKIENKITENTKAIIVMHTYGCPADMNSIKEIADTYNLKIIEDAAEAHGAEYKGRRVGSLGDVACFSFYGNKIITTGEGGMIVTNKEEIANRARSLRNHAFKEPRFIHDEIGYNYRMTNIQAAIGLAQTEVADALVQGRINNARHYNELLKDIPGITLPPSCPYGRNVYWMYGILVNSGCEGLMERLKKRGVDTRRFFFPANRQPMFKNKYPADCPIADTLWNNGLYLPSSSMLSFEDIEKVCIILKEELLK